MMEQGWCVVTGWPSLVTLAHYGIAAMAGQILFMAGLRLWLRFYGGIPFLGFRALARRLTDSLTSDSNAARKEDQSRGYSAGEV